jgi:hypothetical protein
MRLFHITDREIRGDRIIIQGPDLFHVRKVLRKKPGDILSFTDSRFVYQARIDTMDERSLTGQVLEKAPIEPSSPVEIHQFAHGLAITPARTESTSASAVYFTAIWPTSRASAWSTFEQNPANERCRYP